MLIFYGLLLFIVALVYNVYLTIYSMFYRIKINNLLNNINSKEDMLYMDTRDFQNVVAQVLKRKGNKVKVTDKCGEYGNGLLINGLIYAEIWKHSLNHFVDVETAIKLEHCMQANSIYRGMLVTLGDFKQSTRKYCYKNVIECINGDLLLEMCREVQKGREVLQTN